MNLLDIKKNNIKFNYKNGYLPIKASKNSLNKNSNTYIRRERINREIKKVSI